MSEKEDQNQESKSGFASMSDALDKAFADADAQNALLAPPEQEPKESDPPKTEEPPKEPEAPKPEKQEETHDDDHAEQQEEHEEEEPKLPGFEEEEVEPKAEDKPKEDESEPPAEEEEPEEPENPHERGVGKKRVERARRKAIRETEERLKTEYDKKIAELEAKLQQRQSEKPAEGTSLNEAEKEELLMLRRRVSAEDDPEIKQQYDGKIEDNRATIEDVLKQSFPAKEDQDRLSRMGPFDEWAAQPQNGSAAAKILETLAQDNPIQADIIRAKIAENIGLKRGKQRALEERSKDAKEYFAKRNQEAEEQQKQQEVQQAQQQEAVKAAFNKALSYKPLQALPTEGLEGTKLKEVQQENKVRQQMQRFLSDVRDRKYNSVEDGVNIVFAAAKSMQLKHENNKLANRLKELEEQLNKRKEAGSVSRQSRATAATNKRTEERFRSTGDPGRDFDLLLAQHPQEGVR